MDIQVEDKQQQLFEKLSARADWLYQQLCLVDKKCAVASETNDQLIHQLNAVLHLIPSGVVVLNARGMITQCNEMAESILGVTNLIGSQWSSIIAELYSPQEEDGLEVTLKNNKKISVATNQVDANSQIILMSDLTEASALQAQKNQQQRLTALGKMMASIAHQIKTPLSTAILYAHHMCNTDIPIIKREHYAIKIKERLEFLDNMLETMLIFVKGGVPKSEKVCVSQILQDITEVMHDLSKSKQVNFLVYSECQRCKVYVNRKTLVSVLLNLMVNSIQASEQTINICLILKRFSNHVQFVISDKGMGISDSTLQKVWEPFYTTKATGTGLGLAFVKIAIESFKGEVWIKSTPEVGTQVGIQLPILFQGESVA